MTWVMIMDVALATSSNTAKFPSGIVPPPVSEIGQFKKSAHP
jgi:hypothetical protein